MTRICVAGGDERMEYAANALKKAGYEVVRDPDTQDYDALVLPVRSNGITPDGIQATRDCGGCVIGGMLPIHGDGCFDYMKDEAFLYENARITAEGALVLLGERLRGTLYGADVGILGMGRIAECLCRMLCALGVRTTVYARRPEALMRARAMGAKTVRFCDQLPQCVTAHDAICNTVPFMLMDASLLSHVRRDALLLELASAPGGFDLMAVQRGGLCYVGGQGLPGKYAPRAAGELIADYTVRVLNGEVLR